MIYYKSDKEIEIIRKSSLLVGKTLAEVAKLIVPGVKTITLDKLANEFICDNHAIPAFKGYNDFPNTLCISINEQIVHGIPDETVIKDGDIVSVDCGVIIDGYYGDSAYTFAVGNVKPELMQLLKVTKEALCKGIAVAVVGKRLGDIGFEIQTHVEQFGYSVVRELVGHGLGKQLHEKPEVSNYGKRGTGLLLKEGLVIAIEPMVNMGTEKTFMETNKWTIRTADRKPSAHFEHTIAIKKDKTIVLSTYEYIEKVLNKI